MELRDVFRTYTQTRQTVSRSQRIINGLLTAQKIYPTNGINEMSIRILAADTFALDDIKLMMSLGFDLDYKKGRTLSIGSGSTLHIFSFILDQLQTNVTEIFYSNEQLFYELLAHSSDHVFETFLEVPFDIHCLLKFRISVFKMDILMKRPDINPNLLIENCCNISHTSIDILYNFVVSNIGTISVNNLTTILSNYIGIITLEQVKFLIGGGADPKINGLIADLCSSENSVSVLDYLITEIGVNINDHDGPSSPLSGAIMYGRSSMVTYLLDHGVSVRSKFY